MRTLLALTTLTLLGCGAPYEFTTDRSSYARGETITLRLVNNTIGTPSYSLCDVRSEPQLRAEPRVCAAILVYLQAFEAVTGGYAIAADADVGEYVLNTLVGGTVVSTAPIMVTE
ncbi:MAG: hypothetical protein DI536_18225 [Archangium gephyra]|uniref:Lipoprotein n=1 Tax=Archangium gephyra TaxID=48 RepID=A0A2W5UPV0_9BACT|nr:MAG: hypothetical protein DI536_18225 [Archangium gephyra]